MFESKIAHMHIWALSFDKYLNGSWYLRHRKVVLTKVMTFKFDITHILLFTTCSQQRQHKRETECVWMENKERKYVKIKRGTVTRTHERTQGERENVCYYVLNLIGSERITTHAHTQMSEIASHSHSQPILSAFSFCYLPYIVHAAILQNNIKWEDWLRMCVRARERASTDENWENT